MNKKKCKLTDADKMETLWLHDYLHIPYREIADAKDVSPTTAIDGAEDARNTIIENLARKYWYEMNDAKKENRQLKEQNHISYNEYDEY